MVEPTLPPRHYPSRTNYSTYIRLTVSMVDSIGLVLSKICLPAVGFNRCLHSTRHTVNQTIKHFLPNVPPYLHQSFPEFLPNYIRKSMKGCSVWISLVKFHFEQCPQVLDRVHIGAAIPLQQIRVQSSLHQKRRVFFGHMRLSIVLLEYNTTYAIAGQWIEVWEDVIAEDVNRY